MEPSRAESSRVESSRVCKRKDTHRQTANPVSIYPMQNMREIPGGNTSCSVGQAYGQLPPSISYPCDRPTHPVRRADIGAGPGWLFMKQGAKEEQGDSSDHREWPGKPTSKMAVLGHHHHHHHHLPHALIGRGACQLRSDVGREILLMAEDTTRRLGTHLGDDDWSWCLGGCD